MEVAWIRQKISKGASGVVERKRKRNIKTQDMQESKN
jgi:hypothetical protein